MTLFYVSNGKKQYQFEGRLLGSSTSYRRGANRWIEFKLYKTDEKSRYIISRVGVSLYYHLIECEVAGRNNLEEIPRGQLTEGFVPCEVCAPDAFNMPLVAPEKPRPWAQVCETPEGVVDALMKYDSSGNRYLTFVAQRLLEDAAKEDRQLADAYFVETIY